jgi:site-specific DNA-methyltransferase (adenine-specific)
VLKSLFRVPEELVKKLILYSSNTGDLVCDFFMGNFTTAKVANLLGRNVVGFELNKNSYDYWMPLLEKDTFGEWLKIQKKVDVVIPENRGKSFSDEEKIQIVQDVRMFKGTKKSLIEFLMKKHKRGKFSIVNILEKLKPEIEKKSENPFFD